MVSWISNFLNWTLDMDHYFDWHNISDERRIQFVKIKLVGQARQYWTNVKKLMTLKRHEPVQTYDEMKLTLQDKYFLVSYKQLILD